MAEVALVFRISDDDRVAPDRYGMSEEATGGRVRVLQEGHLVPALLVLLVDVGHSFGAGSPRNDTVPPDRNAMAEPAIVLGLQLSLVLEARDEGPPRPAALVDEDLAESRESLSPLGSYGEDIARDPDRPPEGVLELEPLRLERLGLDPLTADQLEDEGLARARGEEVPHRRSDDGGGPVDGQRSAEPVAVPFPTIDLSETPSGGLPKVEVDLAAPSFKRHG